MSNIQSNISFLHTHFHMHIKRSRPLKMNISDFEFFFFKHLQVLHGISNSNCISFSFCGFVCSPPAAKTRVERAEVEGQELERYWLGE